MTEKEVLQLLIYCNELDGRHAPNEVKVMTWQDLLSDSAKGITLDFCRKIVKQHYAKSDAMLAPYMLVKAWNEWRRSRIEASDGPWQKQRHCGFKDCMCTHESPCFKGWIDNDDNYTSPCPRCRQELFEILGRVNPLGLRTASDMALISERKEY